MCHFVLSHLDSNHFVLSHFAFSHFVLGHFVLGHFVLGHFVLGHFVLNHFVLSHFDYETIKEQAASNKSHLLLKIKERVNHINIRNIYIVNLDIEYLQKVFKMSSWFG